MTTIVDLTNEAIAVVTDIFEQVKKENDELRKEVAHWKNNHASEVARARLLKQRLDMPVERVSAYNRLVELESFFSNGIKQFQFDGHWYDETYGQCENYPSRTIVVIPYD